MIEFGVLGPLCVLRDGSQVAVGVRSTGRLLAALLCRANRAVTVAELAEAVWDGDQPADPRRALHVNVHRLRMRLGDDRLIASDHGGYVLEVGAGQVDALRFADLVAQGRAARLRRNGEAARDRFRQALELWRGRAYGTVAHGTVILGEARRLDEQYLLVQEERFEVECEVGVDAGSVGELVELVAANPFRERLSALLMRALHQSGRRAEALEVFRRTRAVLVHELGVEPGGDLQHAHRLVLRDGAGGPRGTVAVTAHRPVPRQLPGGVAGFAGRDHQVRALDRLLPERSESCGPTIAVLTGAAGVGKSTLAVQWGQQVADRFPDGQLHVDLMGFGPDARPLDPAAVVRGFLPALDGTSTVPADPTAQLGLYRSLLARRRILIVLDNARDGEQVRPLLPGAPGCLVLVTSRDPLLGLVAATGAHPLTLEVLPVAEARALLAHRVGPERVAAEPDAVEEIMRWSGRLPLALAVAAGHLTTHPERSLGSVADRLRADGGLDALGTGDATTNLRDVFSWSYRALGSDAALLFRVLGLHAGPDISTAAAAALAGVAPGRARAALAELVRVHLVEERFADRYGCHVLLRSYARELALGRKRAVSAV